MPRSKRFCSGKTAAGKGCRSKPTKGSDRCARHPKTKGGRPSIEWKKKQWELFDTFCRAGVPQVDIAEAMDCSVDSVERIVKRVKGRGFAEYRLVKKGKGRAAVAAKQMQVALNGSVSMLKWLGIQWLDQHKGDGKLDVDVNLSWTDLVKAAAED